jgi:hypothetical protein
MTYANKPTIVLRIKAIIPNDFTGGVYVISVAEYQGETLVEAWSSDKVWAKHDLGFTSERCHNIYRTRFPDGYMLAWEGD